MRQTKSYILELHQDHVKLSSQMKKLESELAFMQEKALKKVQGTEEMEEVLNALFKIRDRLKDEHLMSQMEPSDEGDNSPRDRMPSSNWTDLSGSKEGFMHVPEDGDSDEEDFSE